MVYRIEYAVFLSVFLCGIYFLEQKNYILQCEIKKICGILSVIIFLYQGIVYLPDFSYTNVSADNKKEYIENTFFDSADYDAKKYRKVVNKIEVKNGLLDEIQANPDDYYFLNFGTTIQTLYYEWNPWYVAEWSDNCQYLGGVTTNYPDVIDGLESQKVSNPLRSLVEEDVYLIDNYHTDLIVEYLQEHYYPNARAELYKKVDGFNIWKIYKE